MIFIREGIDFSSRIIFFWQLIKKLKNENNKKKPAVQRK